MDSVLEISIEHQFVLDFVESAMNLPVVSFRKSEFYTSEEDDSECSCTLPPPSKFPPRSRRLQFIGCESTSAKANVTSSKSDKLAYKRIYCKKIGEMIALKESANWSSHKDDHHRTLPDNDWSPLLVWIKNEFMCHYYWCCQCRAFAWHHCRDDGIVGPIKMISIRACQTMTDLYYDYE